MTRRLDLGLFEHLEKNNTSDRLLRQVYDEVMLCTDTLILKDTFIIAENIIQDSISLQKKSYIETYSRTQIAWTALCSMKETYVQQWSSRSHW